MGRNNYGNEKKEMKKKCRLSIKQFITDKQSFKKQSQLLELHQMAVM